MKQKDIIVKIEALETSVGNLKKELVSAGVLGSMHRSVISLKYMKDQINGIKNFLGIKYVTKPPIPAKSFMEKLASTDEDDRY